MTNELDEVSGDLPPGTERPKRGWNTCYRYPPPPPDPETVKRYKAYLTRLSKWLATDIATEKTDYQIGIQTLRGAMHAEGELTSYLDDAWAKRVFSDKDLFTDVGGGFWKVAQLDPDEAPGEPTRWQGVRPGEDVLGHALMRARFSVEHLDRPDWKSKWLTGPQWAPIHFQMVMALGWVQSRGIDKPLVPFQERAFLECLVDEDEHLQTVGLWLMRSRMHLEAFQRFQHAVKTKDLSGLYSDDLIVYQDDVIRPEGQPHTVQDSLKFTRRILVERGILYGKKD